MGSAVMLFLVIVAAAAMLLVYSMIEKRIGQRACPVCGFTMSADAVEQQCPRCDSTLGGRTRD